MPNFEKTIEELKTPFDKWLYVLKHLPYLDDRPAKLREKIFERLFEAAEIAKFTRLEMAEYESSLKIYRDIKNVIDTAFDDGEIQGVKKNKRANIVKALKRGKLTLEEIAEDNEITIEEILAFKNEQGS